MKLLCLLALLTVCACTRPGPYRTQIPGSQPAANQPDLRTIEDHGRYKIAFVEFDDQGKWELGDKQIKAAEKLLRDVRHLDPATGAVLPGTGGGFTVLYVHGWKNNAQSIEGRRKDVEKFRDFMAEIAGDLDLNVPITGVYLGWRGRSVDITSGFLNFYTLWPRYWAAGNIGRDEDTVQRSIARVVNAGIAGKSQLLGDRRPRMILIGHSLGGRLLQEAIERPQTKNGLILGQCVSLTKTGHAESPVDLVLLVNEATKSYTVRRANQLCVPPAGEPDQFLRHPAYTKARCENSGNSGQAICRPYPLFVHITSEADWATRFLLPAALFGRSAPHIESLRTHSITDITNPGTVPPNSLFTFKSREHLYSVASQQKDPRHPIWLMRTDKFVMANHGDIWSPGLRDMLFSLMGRLEIAPLKSRTKASTVPSK